MVKLVVLGVDICTSFALTIMSLLNLDVTDEVKANVSILGGALFVYTCVVIVICVQAPRKNVLPAVGGLFYFIGDNLPLLVKDYGKQLFCDQVCVEEVQIAGIIMLGIATVTYIPVLYDSVPVHKGTPTNNNETEETPLREDKTPVNVVVLLLLAKLTNLTLVYTAIERVTAKHCGDVVTVGVWAYFGVYLTAFFCVSMYKM